MEDEVDPTMMDEEYVDEASVNIPTISGDTPISEPMGNNN